MPTHHEKCLLPFTPAQIYPLVAQVDKYPEFLPWVMNVKVSEEQNESLIATVEVGYKIFKESYRCQVLLTPNSYIEIKYLEGPFKYLINHWTFSPTTNGQTLLEFYIDFEFQSLLLQSVMGPFFQEAVKRMIKAFEERAKNIYSLP